MVAVQKPVGIQDETVIVRWFPGETRGVDGSGVTITDVPTSITTDTLNTAETYTDDLRAELVASGVLPDNAIVIV